MGKQIDIKLPAQLKDYNLRQMQNLLDFLASQKDPRPVQEAIDCIHAVTGIEKDMLRRVDYYTGIKPAYAHIQNTLNVRIKKAPPTEIKIGRQVFVFDQNISSEAWNTGRLIDADNRSIEIDQFPEYVCAICYIEKGTKYGYPPSEGGCMPMEQRAALMRDNFSGEDFLNLYAFFLRKFYQLSPGFSILQIARAQIARKEAAKKMQEIG